MAFFVQPRLPRLVAELEKGLWKGGGRLTDPRAFRETFHMHDAAGSWIWISHVLYARLHERGQSEMIMSCLGYRPRPGAGRTCASSSDLKKK